MRRSGWILAVLALLALWAWQRHGLPAFAGAQSPAAESPADRDTAGIERPGRWPAFLPPEAHETLALIEAGGPFPHRQDGATFQNREHRLPPRESGYYREYTVETPGSPDRGARRIIAGGDPPDEFFYTDDHYGSFRRFTADGDDAGSDDADAGDGGAR